MAIYLFFGEEQYLIETKVKKIKKDFGDLIQGINYIQIDETNVEELISDLETPAFGFSKKLIIVKNTGLFKKEKKTATKKEAKNGKLTLAEKVAKYIQENEKEITQTIELVFVEEEVDKNTLYKVIESVGEIK